MLLRGATRMYISFSNDDASPVGTLAIEPGAMVSDVVLETS